MDLAYRYGGGASLYLNVTNRCTNRCSFCVRRRCEGLEGAVLRGDAEPDLADLRAAVEAHGGAGAFDEIVWCGFGEPTFRLDLIVAASPAFREAGAGVRLDTNGHAALIHGRDVWPDLAPVLDAVSVSLNAPDRDRYLDLCRPDPTSIPGRAGLRPEAFWEATVDFLRRSGDHVDRVVASVVGGTLEDDEVEAAEALARSLGADAFRVR